METCTHSTRKPKRLRRWTRKNQAWTIMRCSCLCGDRYTTKWSPTAIRDGWPSGHITGQTTRPPAKCWGNRRFMTETMTVTEYCGIPGSIAELKGRWFNLNTDRLRTAALIAGCPGDWIPTIIEHFMAVGLPQVEGESFDEW